LQCAANVEARRVGQAHAGFHQRFGPGALAAALEVGQLHEAVHAEHLGVVLRRRGHHRHALGHRHGDDVGQVVLALHVVVLQRRDPALQRCGGRGHHAGVDLANGALRRTRVLLLDDGAHGLALAHDAAVATGVVEHQGQQREALPATGLYQRTRRVGAHQRHVAVEDQCRALVVEQRQGLPHGVAGAELRFLAHAQRTRCGGHRLDLIGAIARDHQRAVRVQLSAGGQDMLQ
jgi:hypothetical protein